MRIVIIGAGIIGAAIAHGLAAAGMRPVVLEQGMPGQGASARSFGWLNASFFENRAHFRLRVEALAAWRRLAAAGGVPGLRWPGALWFEETGAAFDRMAETLRDLEYPVEALDAAQIAAREPGLATPPERALLFPEEGIADLTRACGWLLAGAEVIAGLPATAVETRGGRVTGVATPAGRIEADAVVVAAGTEAPALVAPLGVALPMLERPGVLMRSAPLPPVLRHVLVAPGQELRQDPDGCITAPTSPNHQADSASALAARPDALADQAAARIAALLGREVAWRQVALAMRPVPGDGLPVIGPAGPEGLYLAVMHSGATLAALVGELASGEILRGAAAPLLAPYRPGRFG
jgi:glycine/D-amino acid oxidase-like deaminating enzyme